MSKSIRYPGEDGGVTRLWLGDADIYCVTVAVLDVH